MRTVLITLSSVIYAAAAFIAAAALMIPSAPPVAAFLPSAPPAALPAAPLPSSPPVVAPLPSAPPAANPFLEESLGQLAREREADRKLVADLTNTIAELQSELAVDREGEALEELTREQAANRKLIADLKENLADFQKETRESTTAADTPAGPSREARLLETPVRRNGDIPDSADLSGEFSQGETPGQLIALIGGGLFDSGQVDLSADLKAAVERILPIIALNPELHIAVEGHTDNKPIGKSLTGKYDNNRTLSLSRARIIARLIEEQGVPAERIVVIGYGSAKPLASNDTAEGRAENRRVEVRLMPPAREWSE